MKQDMFNLHFANEEHEEAQPVIVDGSESLAHKYGEMTEELHGVDYVDGVVSTALDDTDKMEEIAEVLESSDSTGGASELSIQMAEVSVERFRQKYGIKKAVLPGLENFSNANTRKSQTAVAVEGIKEMATAVWEYIVGLYRKIARWLSNAVESVFNFLSKLEVSFKLLSAKIASARAADYKVVIKTHIFSDFDTPLTRALQMLVIEDSITAEGCSDTRHRVGSLIKGCVESAKKLEKQLTGMDVTSGEYREEIPEFKFSDIGYLNDIEKDTPLPPELEGCDEDSIKSTNVLCGNMYICFGETPTGLVKVGMSTTSGDLRKGFTVEAKSLHAISALVDITLRDLSEIVKHKKTIKDFEKSLEKISSNLQTSMKKNNVSDEDISRMKEYKTSFVNFGKAVTSIVSVLFHYLTSFYSHYYTYLRGCIDGSVNKLVELNQKN